MANKVCLVKGMVFPVVMYGCENWTIKKPEHWRIGAFELWCWRRLLRVHWTARKSNQSILKEISPGCSLEGLMLKLKLQYFGHLMWKADSLEKTLMLERLKAGGEGDDRGWDGWMVSWTQWTWIWVNFGVGDGQGGLACCSSGVAKSQTQLSDWTELNPDSFIAVVLKVWFPGMPHHCHVEFVKSTFSAPPQIYWLRNIIWHPLYVESKKKWYKWTYLQNRKRLTDLENRLTETGGRGIYRVWDQHGHTAVFQVDHQQGPM